jgi:hypothetical protein
MSGVSNWKPYKKFVQGGMLDGDFANGQFVLLAAGPPHMSNFGGPSQLGAQDVVYPIGLTQNLALSHNRVFSRIFEIGSERSYFIPGRTVGQLTLSRVYYHGPSLLRALWAYYADAPGTPHVQSLWDHGMQNLDFPYLAGASGGDTPRRSSFLHDVQIPAGFENVFLNLASDLFQNPIGLLLLVRDSNEQNLAGAYLEQCYVPTHTWATDSQGLIIQESVGVQFERLVPLRMSAVSLLRGLRDGNILDPVSVASAL